MIKKTTFVILCIIICVSLSSCKNTKTQTDTQAQPLNIESIENTELSIIETTDYCDEVSVEINVEEITETTKEDCASENDNNLKPDTHSNTTEGNTTTDWEQSIPETTQELVTELSPQQTPFG